LPLPAKHRNVVIVGLMGAGKTTVGRQLASRLKWRFVDTDHEIERRTGVRIPVIFEIEGEDGFRRRESQVLSELLESENMVLATGGGAVLKPENRECLRLQGGLVAYLHVSPGLLHSRTRNDRNRPLLQVADPLAKLQSLLAERDPYYREVAGMVIDGDRYSARQIVTLLEKEVQSACAA
jgi:shikimate kinase